MAVLIDASYSVPQMIVGRIVLGVGVGGAAAIAPLFITETAPTAVRGRCIGVKCVIFMSALRSSKLNVGVVPSSSPLVRWFQKL